MVINETIFQVNCLPKKIIVQVDEDTVVCGAFLDKRRGLRINFPTEKLKTIIYTPAPTGDNALVNLNGTVYRGGIHYINHTERYTNLLKWKVRWKFRKFKYRGKGFKIKKFNTLSKLTFKLGKSH